MTRIKPSLKKTASEQLDEQNAVELNNKERQARFFLRLVEDWVRSSATRVILTEQSDGSGVIQPLDPVKGTALNHTISDPHGLVRSLFAQAPEALQRSQDIAPISLVREEVFRSRPDGTPDVPVLVHLKLFPMHEAPITMTAEVLPRRSKQAQQELFVELERLRLTKTYIETMNRLSPSSEERMIFDGLSVPRMLSAMHRIREVNHPDKDFTDPGPMSQKGNTKKSRPTPVFDLPEINNFPEGDGQL